MGSKLNEWGPWIIASLIAVATAGFAFWIVGSMGSRPEPAGAAAAAGENQKKPGSMDPGQVDDALIAHIQAGRYDEAYALMSSAYRATVPLADFARAARRNRYLQTSKWIGCYKVETWEDGVEERQCILHAAAGNSRAALFYALDDGQWRLTGILIGGTPAFPGVASHDLPQRAEAATTEAPGTAP